MRLTLRDCRELAKDEIQINLALSTPCSSEVRMECEQELAQAKQCGYRSKK
jgi:hypothetical protein